jgi:HlyD family secretion protein
MTVFRWIIAILLTLIVLGVAAKALEPRKKPPTEVQSTKVDKATITRTVSGAGKLEPATKVNVSAQITGILLDLKVDIGSQVKKGDYLGQIDTSRYQAVVSQSKGGLAAANADVNRARANVSRLRKDFARLEALAQKNAIGLSEVETAEDLLRQGEAELAAAQSRAQSSTATLRESNQALEWATLRAPVDGTVLSLNHRVGERMRGSELSEDVILTIGTVHKMEVKIEVGEHDVVFLKPGQVASIEIDALPDRPLRGHVKETGRDALIKNAGTDNEVTTFPVWIIMDELPPEALSGMSARVDIFTETKENVVAVPVQAVTVRPREGSGRDEEKNLGEGVKSGRPPGTPEVPGGGRGRLEKVVFVIKDGKVQKRKVTTGLSSDAHVEIVEGLTPGEEIVEGPYRVLARQINDGDEISVAPMGGGPNGKSGPRGPQ